MASTRIEDLPDNLDDGNFIQGDIFHEETASIVDNTIKEIKINSSQPKNMVSLIKDTVFVLFLLLFLTNNEVQKGIGRFPGLKLQRSDLSFSILISVIFAAIFALVKFFLL